MRISDWSSDVCSSDLSGRQELGGTVHSGRNECEIGPSVERPAWMVLWQGFHLRRNDHASRCGGRGLRAGGGGCQYLVECRAGLADRPETGGRPERGRRSEERRGGKEGVSTCNYRGS